MLKFSSSSKQKNFHGRTPFDDNQTTSSSLEIYDKQNCNKQTTTVMVNTAEVDNITAALTEWHIGEW